VRTDKLRSLAVRLGIGIGAARQKPRHVSDDGDVDRASVGIPGDDGRPPGCRLLSDEDVPSRRLLRAAGLAFGVAASPQPLLCGRLSWRSRLNRRDSIVRCFYYSV
jgi:hypothetical protein